jgi:hypothetical protein
MDERINKKSHLFHYWFVLLPEEETLRPEMDKYQSLSISSPISKPNIQPEKHSVALHSTASFSLAE